MRTSRAGEPADIRHDITEDAAGGHCHAAHTS